MRRRERWRWAGLLAVLGLVFTLGRGSAQGMLPNGVFVSDSAGNVWLVLNGARSHVPFYPTTDDTIAAVPESGQWVVPGADGALTLGEQPEWVGMALAPPAPAPASTPTPTPAPDDLAPTVTLQVDDDRIETGQHIAVTVIGNDDKGLEWIEWEGTIVEGGDNDNRSTGDPALDDRHRHDCDDEKQCAFVWQVTPTKAGSYTLRARGRDNNGQRSEWTTLDLRIRQGSTTPTPTKTP
ncbi:MAG: hypothetical protein IT305_04245 [Chloroflexi bacterium]|nr:hypothetical protein [Chloroflexota bacterium]